MIRKSLAALAALSLAVTPALAQNTAPAPAAESLSVAQDEGNSLMGAGIAPILFGVIVLMGVLLAAETFPFEEDPTSP